jgi:hypothetical protein
MINTKKIIRVIILLLSILFMPSLVGCTPAAAPVQLSSTFEALLEESPTFELSSPSATLTITSTNRDTVSPSITYTTSPTIDIEALLSELTIDEARLQFAAIKRYCQVPEEFTLSDLDLACFFTGIEQGEFRNFSSISQYDRMRIEYALLDSEIVPEPFIEHTILAVYQHEQDGDYSESDPLFEVPLMIDEEQPDSFFGDLDLIALARTRLIAFHIVLQGYGAIEYRADQILFYVPDRATATTSDNQQLENQIVDTATNPPPSTATKPPPTATQPPPTATQIPTPTQPLPPTATQPPPPTSTPLPTMPPRPTPTATLKPG